MAVNEISSYRFGEVVVGGQSYTADVIIFPDRVVANWWRRSGHELHPEDLTEVVAVRPEVLVVGTGEPGMLEVLPETRKSLENKGVELVAEPTGRACQRYNQLCRSRRVVAALHLTC